MIGKLKTHFTDHQFHQKYNNTFTKMKSLHFFLLATFFILSCQTQTENPLVAKHQAQYDLTKTQMLANKSEILRIIQQLPPGYQDAIQKGIGAIEKYDLAEFLKNEKMNEEGLLQVFESINEFLENIEGTQNFKATTEQTEMYNLFRNRLIENTKFVDPFIAACEKSKDPNQLASGLFLKKVMQYDIHNFVQNTFIEKEEFEQTFSEVNENWDEFITNIKCRHHRNTFQPNYLAVGTDTAHLLIQIIGRLSQCLLLAGGAGHLIFLIQQFDDHGFITHGCCLIYLLATG